ncbi:group II truncated hemoglobin [Pelistega europaea]|uniref:Group II truncated hemoglobin n=1 Tax=Pelistega europaea TaxID=106147 RepID=A0A7Y4P4N2_9BURK|nr:group II truncated hemoglobin [Pelistega europaea]NOL49666.1 group II truncated hemoglobin [Pelistega europaea]
MVKATIQTPSLQELVTYYDRLGGEQGVRNLVERFYDLMDLEPRFKELRDTHGATLEPARMKLFLFLSGWLGGPDLYVERFGHPRLRARHMPFSIGTVERDQWVGCMAQALMDLDVEQELQDKLLAAFFDVADWMRNRAD